MKYTKGGIFTQSDTERVSQAERSKLTKAKSHENKQTYLENSILV